eukprot:scaffold39024_cov72-Cyclotella_meneghiniana.AAC.8
MITTAYVQVMDGDKVEFANCQHQLFSPRLSEFGLIQAINFSLTLTMSHCKYNEWFGKVFEI